jgi:hypothetical protein
MEPKDRRKFLGDAATLAASLSILPGILPSFAGQGDLSQVKILAWEDHELPDGRESSGKLGFNQLQIGVYMRRVEADSSYVVFSTMALPGAATFTRVVSATKGPVEGDVRLDTMQATTIKPDGAVSRNDPRQVKVLISHPYAGLSPQETLDAFSEDRAAGRWDFLFPAQGGENK